MKKIIYSIAATIIVLAVVIGIGVSGARANPQYFPPTAQTSSATSSPQLMQAATASTTVAIFDSYYETTLGANTKTADAALLVQFAGTNTPVLNLAVQYAHHTPGFNCVTTPLACDWYDNNLSINSTAYPSPSVSFANILVWTSNNATTSKAFALSMPTRYVRIQAKVTSAPGAVWAQIVPNKERTESR